MPSTTTSGAGAAASTESIWAKLKSVLLAFIFRNSIQRQLEEMTNAINDAVERGEMTQESIEKLSETIDQLAGKLRNTSPEQMQQTADEAKQIINAMVDSLYEAGKIVDGTKNEPNFYAAVKGMSEKYKGMSDAEFKKHFNENAKIYDIGKLHTENDATEGKSSLIIELDGESYQAEFNVSEPKAINEEHPEKKKRELTISVSKYTDSYPDAKAISTEGIGGYEAMMRSFLEPRGLRRESDVKRLDMAKLRKEHQEIRDFEFVESCRDKAVDTPDGKAEYLFDSKTNQFRFRDKQSGDMIIIGMKQNSVAMITASKTDSLTDAELMKKLTKDSDEKGSWVYDREKHTTTYSLKFANSEMASLFRSPAILQYLETKGVNTEEFVRSMARQGNAATVGYSKMHEGSEERINRLSYALSDKVNYDDAYSDLTFTDKRIKPKDGKDGAIYLTLRDKKTGYEMSFNLDADGNPERINFRKSKDSKFKFIHNYRTHLYGANYEALKNDPNFMKLFLCCTEARDLFLAKETQIRQSAKEDEKEAVGEAKAAPVMSESFKTSISSRPENSPEGFRQSLNNALSTLHDGQAGFAFFMQRFVLEVSAESERLTSHPDGTKSVINLNQYPTDFIRSLQNVTEMLHGLNPDDYKADPKKNLEMWISEFIGQNGSTAAAQLEDGLRSYLGDKKAEGQYNRCKQLYFNMFTNGTAPQSPNFDSPDWQTEKAPVAVVAEPVNAEKLLHDTLQYIMDNPEIKTLTVQDVQKHFAATNHDADALIAMMKTIHAIGADDAINHNVVQSFHEALEDMNPETITVPKAVSETIPVPAAPVPAESKADALSITSKVFPNDELLAKAAAYAVEKEEITTTALQRTLKLGYARTAKLMDDLQEAGIIGEAVGARPRKVLMTAEQLAERNGLTVTAVTEPVSMEQEQPIVLPDDRRDLEQLHMILTEFIQKEPKPIYNAAQFAKVSCLGTSELGMQISERLYQVCKDNGIIGERLHLFNPTNAEILKAEIEQRLPELAPPVPFAEPAEGIPEFSDSEFQNNFMAEQVSASEPSAMMFNPPSLRPEVQAELESKRIEALCRAANIPPKVAEIALKKADFASKTTSGVSTLNENFIGRTGLGSTEAFISTLSKHIGVSESEGREIYERAIEEFDNLDMEDITESSKNGMSELE